MDPAKAELRLECLRLVMQRPDTSVVGAVQDADRMFRWVMSGEVPPKDYGLPKDSNGLLKDF